MISGLEIIKEALKQAPKLPGVYRMLDEDGKALYVGKAKNIANRFKNYTNLKDLPNRLKQMVFATKEVKFITTNSEVEALLLEADLIKSLKPKFNILLRDGKTLPFIKINTSHKYPGIFKHRGEKNSQDKYFGPFAYSFNVSNTIETLKKIFLVRSCPDSEFKIRKSPCLEYQIKRCSAPCVGKISETEYQRSIQQITDFLNGKSSEIHKLLINQMQDASGKMEFEKAAKLRDRLHALTTIMAKQNISNNGIIDADVIAVSNIANKFAIQIYFYRSGMNYGEHIVFMSGTEESNKSEILSEFLKQWYAEQIPSQLILGEEIEEREQFTAVFSKQAEHRVEILIPKKGVKKELLKTIEANALKALQQRIKVREAKVDYLKKIKELFGLARSPRRIEVYDNSHFGGDNALGVMVVAGDEGFLKKHYRKYYIKDQEIYGDDYAMLYEVLSRRFKQLIKDDPAKTRNMWPDLLLIDGGKGQASIVQKLFHDMNIKVPFFCIAKGKARKLGEERFCNFDRDYFKIKDKQALYYLQILRDEAHNFAIKNCRMKSVKKIRKSALDDISGIGAAKKQLLLSYFGSVEKIKSQSQKDLEIVPGISKNLAGKIYNFFQEN